jgi:hypothetical protein
MEHMGYRNEIMTLKFFPQSSSGCEAFSLSFTVGFLAEPRHRRWAETARHEAVLGRNMGKPSTGDDKNRDFTGI